MTKNPYFRQKLKAESVLNEIRSKIGEKRFHELNDGTYVVETLASEIAQSSELFNLMIAVSSLSEEYRALFDKYIKLETLISHKIKLFDICSAFIVPVAVDESVIKLMKETVKK